jgi:glycosyltransferase involved in cell wall biosynthesis
MPILLQISIEVNSGSVGRIAEQIGKTAIDYGWESYITYARNHLPSKSKTIKIGNRLDIYWHGINTRLFDNHCLKSTGSTIKLIAQIKAIKPDIILLHHIHGYFLNMEVLFNYLSIIDTPVVWIFHDCWSMTGHCAYFDYVDCNKWLDGCYKCPQKNRYPASFFLDRSKRNYQLKKELFTSTGSMTIVPVSNWLGEIVKRSFFKKYPMQIIPNGIDTDIFLPKQDRENIREKFKLGQKFVILGVAGIWEERKGLTDFFELNDIIDHKEYKIVLIGLNKKQIKYLQKEILGIERTENVQELADFYSCSDVFLNPTWEDTFPTTNLESLACGTPVITYQTGGSVESVSADTGVVVDKGDVAGLYEAVRTIKTRGKQFYTYNCRQRAVVNYDRRDRFKDYINLFEKLIGKI